MAARTYTTRRSAIIDALVVELKKINQTGAFLSDVYDNVHPRLKFWDEVDSFPAIHLNAGSETREYHYGIIILQLTKTKVRKKKKKQAVKKPTINYFQFV